jgi:hypothetical protein
VDNSNESTLTTIVAIWGAVAGSIALAWDFYKWRISGPKIIIEAADGNKIFSTMGALDNKTYVTVRVINRGDKPTTLDRIAVQTYKNHSWFHKFISRPISNYHVIPITNQQLPFKLESSVIWDGYFPEAENHDQDSDILMKIFVFCSHGKRAASTIVRKNLHRKKKTLEIK